MLHCLGMCYVKCAICVPQIYINCFHHILKLLFSLSVFNIWSTSEDTNMMLHSRKFKRCLPVNTCCINIWADKFPEKHEGQRACDRVEKHFRYLSLQPFYCENRGTCFCTFINTCTLSNEWTAITGGLSAINMGCMCFNLYRHVYKFQECNGTCFVWLKLNVLNWSWWSRRIAP